MALCPTTPVSCPAYDNATNRALLSELHTIFAGALACAAVAGVLALVLLGGRNRGPLGDPEVTADAGDTTTSSALPRLLG